MRAIILFTALTCSASLLAQLGLEHRFIYPTTNQGLGVHDMDGDGDGDILRADGGHLWMDEQIAPNEFRITMDLGPAVGVDIIRSGDLDGDGIEDIVFALPNDGTIVWVRVLADGLYSPIQNLVAGLYHPLDVRLADVDGDLDLDLVHADSTVTIHWNENLGGGDFGPGQLIYAGPVPNASYGNSTFDVADIDGDGDPDLAMVLPTLRWFQNDGSGSFTTIPIVGGTDCYDILLTDIDGDFDPDIVLAYFYSLSGYLIKLVNNGGGAFGPEQFAGAGATVVNGLLAADLDGDGDQDIVTRIKLWDIGPRAISLAINDGSGTFSTGYSIFLAGDQWAHYCTGDLNGDAAADIVGYAGDGLKFKLGNSSLEQRLNSVQGPKQICAANFIGDPLPEAVVCGELLIGPLNEAASPLQMAMHENLGGGLMQEGPRPLWTSRAPIMNASPVDLNGDGAMDLITLRENSFGNGVRYVVFMNNGLGQLDSTSAVGSPFTYGIGALPYLRDMDQDGDMDLMHSDVFQVGVCLNNGDGTFASENVYPINGAVCLCDVDHDGDDDLVQQAVGTQVFWYANNGMGVPGAAQPTGNPPMAVLSTNSPDEAHLLFGTDLDNDGWQDLVLFSGDSLGTMRNTGGDLAAVQSWYCGAVDHAIGDVDGDNSRDLVVLRANSDIVLYPNTGNCTFGAGQLLASAPQSTGTSDIELADMDGDGRLDVLTCSANGSAAWFGNDLPLNVFGSSINAAPVFRVFPNPFTDRTRIVLNEDLGADVLIEISDAQGRSLRLAYGTDPGSMMIECGDLGPGLYLIRALRHNVQFGAARLVVE